MLGRLLCGFVAMPSLLVYRPSTGNSWELDRPTAAALLQLIPSLDTLELQGPLGSAIAAVISSDPELRQTLLKGACFFALAAAKGDQNGAKVAQMQSQLKDQQDQAEDVVLLVETSIQKVVKEVGCPAVSHNRQHTTDQLCVEVWLQRMPQHQY